MDDYYECWVMDFPNTPPRLGAVYADDTYSAQWGQSVANDTGQNVTRYHIVWSYTTILGVTLLARRTVTSNVYEPV